MAARDLVSDREKSGEQEGGEPRSPRASERVGNGREERATRHGGGGRR
jgi:hypothetical protein